MTTAYTGSLRITKPGVGDPTVKNQWGALVNTDMDLIDSAITGLTTVDLTGLMTVTLTANNGAADQSRPFALQLINAGSVSPLPVILPSVVKFGLVSNISTVQVVLQTAAGGSASTLTINPNTGWFYYYCDGTNVVSILAVKQFSNESMFLPTGSAQAWTAPYTGTIKLRMWAGGGPGGQGYGGQGAGGGGGGGQYFEYYVGVVAGQTFLINPGSGGTPANSGSAGTSGGNTTFNSSSGATISLSVFGGGAGGDGSGSTDGYAGASGGGLYSTPGQRGARISGLGIYIGGAGGGSFGSQGAFSPIGTSAAGGVTPTQPGAGGAGGALSQGTFGGPGQVILEY